MIVVHARREELARKRTHSVQFLLLSGGAIDPSRTDYVEAERAREYLIATYSATWQSLGLRLGVGAAFEANDFTGHSKPADPLAHLAVAICTYVGTAIGQ